MGSSLATARGMRRAALAWTALCVVLGILVALSTWQLRDTGDALDTAGVALERTGKTVSAFDSLPLVGSGAGAAGDRIRERGAQVTAAADDARTRIAIVSISSGVLVALIGSVPVLLLWRYVDAVERR